jgi:hypothetical protein
VLINLLILFHIQTFKTPQTGGQDPPGSQQQPKDDDEDKKAADNQIRALKITMYVMGGIILGSGLYIFFVYGKFFSWFVNEMIYDFKVLLCSAINYIEW